MPNSFEPPEPQFPDSGLDDGMTWESLARYVSGEADVAEVQRVDSWRSGHAEREALVERWSIAWKARLAHDDWAPNVGAIWQAVLASIGDDAPAELHEGLAEATRPTTTAPTPNHSRVARPPVRPASSSIGRHSWVPIALAGSAIAIAAILVGRSGKFGHSGEKFADAQTYVTENGQRATVKLADGSAVTLAPATTVIISRDAATSARVVNVSGEAHFTVVPNAHTAFMVRSGAMTTRVLGTQFDVRRYPGDSIGQVAVFSGRVATATARGGATVLSAGMVGQFTDSSTVGVTTGVAREYADWTQGRLVFEYVPVSTLLTTLQRWSGYQFRLTDSTLAHRHVTTAFVIGENQAMLKQLQEFLDVRMTFQDSVVTLSPLRGVPDSIRTKTRRVRDADSHVTEFGR